MKQKEVSVLDFNAIDWDMVNQEKAAFIHNEILQYNKELIDHMNIVTSKVLGFVVFAFTGSIGGLSYL